MARIFFGEVFTFEDMAEMGITMSAANLGPPTIGISETFYRARKIIIECRPAAPGIEFCLRIIERRIATAADICAQ